MCRCEAAEGLPRLEVNFDPALVVVLREVRYFLSMRNPSIDDPRCWSQGAQIRLAAVGALFGRSQRDYMMPGCGQTMANAG